MASAVLAQKALLPEGLFAILIGATAWVDSRIG
jgi:hypothetical protein